MLPNRAGTYELYKSDTDAIANWLANTARRCGYPPDLLADWDARRSDTSQQTPRLKGKACKLAREAATTTNGHATGQEESTPSLPIYVVAVKDFIPLAACIASYKKKPVTVPSEIARSLSRAIALRKGHAAKFQSFGNADEGHDFFISVLEQVRENLQGCMPSRVVDHEASTSERRSNVQDRGLSHVSTLFSHLELEEPSENHVHAHSASTVMASTQNDPVTARYRAERVGTWEEMACAAYCVFEDVAIIRTIINRLWSKYHAGEIDLQAVSLTTNIAVELVRQKEEDFGETFPKNEGFHKLVVPFWLARCPSSDAKPKKEWLKDTLLCTENYHLGDDILLPAFMIMESLHNLMSDWLDDPGQVPVYKPGVSGQRDHSIPRSRKTHTEKFEEDKRALIEIFRPLFLLAATAAETPLGGDELLRGISKMIPGTPVPLWLAFAAQTFLDAQHIMGPATDRAFSELQNEAQRIRLMMGNGFSCHEHKPLRHVPPPNSDDFSSIREMIHVWLDQDLVGSVLESIEQEHDPHVECKNGGHELLKQYPGLCGVWLFKIRLTIQRVGINFTNAWGSMSPCAHLYNAVRHEQLLESAWPGMERAMVLHKSDKIFIGEPPNAIEDYFKRFCLCRGFSATGLSRDSHGKKTGRMRWSQNGPRLLSDGSLALSKIVASRYINETSSHPSNLPAMQKLISPAEFGLEPSSLAFQDVDLLCGLALGLNREVPAMTFDYFALHNGCWDLLNEIRDKVGSSIINEFQHHVEIMNLDDSSQIVSFLLISASKAERTKSKHSSGRVASEAFTKAARIMREMLSSGRI
ncbi:hypothetical protein MBLNU457_4586t2 [Dothideomycetes sp. NU457]